MEPLYDDAIWAEAARRLALHAHAHVEERSQDDDFEALRSKLGSAIPLAEATTDHWLFGRYRGREVLLCRSGLWTGTAFVAAIDPPLRLGLHARRMAREGSKVPPIRRLFEVTALEPDRGLSLFEETTAGQALSERLRELDRRFNGPDRQSGGFLARFDDTTAIAEVAETPDGADHFVERLDTLIDLVEQLEAGRRELPPSSQERALSESLRAVARSLELFHDEDRATLSGAIDGVEVRVSVPVGAAGVTTVIRAGIDPPLGLGLRVTAERPFATLRSWVGKGDLRTGDDAFDEAFFVSGEPADAARAALNDEARALFLVERRRGASVDLADDHLEIVAPGAPGNHASLLRRLGDVVTLVSALRRARANANASPYR